MLVSFTIENWMSFRDKTTFSMVASRERQHGERLASLDAYKTRLLPVAAIYGGNASGKTNFFKALNFIKRLVVRGTRPGEAIAVVPFLLDSHAKEPVRFIMELLADNKVYEFSFAVTAQEVIEEKLIEIISEKEKVLYHRKQGNSDPQLDQSLEKLEFLQFAFQGTRDNQLYLTNAISQKVEVFRPVYDWFDKSLVLIAPDTRFQNFEGFFGEGPLSAVMNELLPQLDTGITKLGGQQIQFEHLPLSPSLKQQMQETLNETKVVKIAFTSSQDQERYLVTKKGLELLTERLTTYHTNETGEDIPFSMNDESDGTCRVIDLLPAFLDIAHAETSKVYVIDELDRSLHSLLTRKLLTQYLNNCHKDHRTQLLFTTHDVLLMDQALLRRDEMWVAERNSKGVSSLYSFGDFKEIRYDKDIRKSYLQGRLGGIPRLLLCDALAEISGGDGKD